MTSALDLAGLTKVFGENVAVDHLDLTIPQGSFYGLVGQNGAGKTTTISMAVGLLRPDEGAAGHPAWWPRGPRNCWPCWSWTRPGTLW
jgi:ABC-2 type transport system ATP-binding protein